MSLANTIHEAPSSLRANLCRDSAVGMLSIMTLIGFNVGDFAYLQDSEEACDAYLI